MTRSSTQRSAFTLVELLVAISIIAVLIAILLPSLSSARDAARKIKCGNNIRQITIATTNFTYDEKGVYPYGGYMPLGWPGGIGISWDDLTSEYYGQELTEAQMESNGIGLENPLLLCPNNPVQYIGTFAPRDYVLNAAIGRVYQGSTPAPPPFRANESDVRAPARTLLHVEAPNDSSNNGRGRVQAASIPRPLNQVAGGIPPPSTPAYIWGTLGVGGSPIGAVDYGVGAHGGFSLFNYAYADGHVETQYPLDTDPIEGWWTNDANRPGLFIGGAWPGGGVVGPVGAWSLNPDDRVPRHANASRVSL